MERKAKDDEIKSWSRGQSEEESKFEETLRPTSFREFVGQAKTIENLIIAIKAAKKRRESLDHILFSGLPGLGKTTLARLISCEMRVPLKQTAGPILKRPGDLASTLTKLADGEILFIDEIHRISKDVEEYLYSAIEDFFINVPLESGLHGRTVNINLKRFTLIGATTREGLLSDPFRARFGILEKLESYPPEEIQKIVNRSAKILNVKIDEESSLEIARRSRGVPRLANRYLRRIRDLAQVKADNVIDMKITAEGLRMLGVDQEGLDNTDRKILTTLVSHQGAAVGLKTIAVAVGEEEDTIEEVYEPYLIQCHFVRAGFCG
ncbi:MAG: Holliday junction DNA helicase RuvB [Planctomycetes bacterium RBG_16_59_8]|nr:MAG: Holliday junction DNA helicase RuvB [Planctomycetes bacterium RBG_16_59_8]